MFRMALLLSLAVTATAAGQDKDKDKKTEAKIPILPPARTSSASDPMTRIVTAPAVPGDVEVHFLNGSIVRMLLHSDKLEVSTPYGRLAVPMTEVRAVEFGLHLPEGVQDKIDKAIVQLSAKEFRERDRAGKALLELSPYSYPAAYEASRSPELETSRRAKELVKQIQSKHPKRDLRITVDDKVVTPTFAIVGRILTPTIKAKTELFGPVELSIAKMRTLKAIAAPSSDTELTVDAAKYASAAQWMDTGYEVDGRSNIVITAKGLVDTWPQGPGQYMVGPNGNPGMRNQLGVLLGGGGRKIGGAVVGQMYGGVLLGKIGDTGEPFIIGDHFEGNPETEGKLYLHIGPSPWNCASTGKYEVTISRK